MRPIFEGKEQQSPSMLEDETQPFRLANFISGHYDSGLTVSLPDEVSELP